MAVEWHTRPPPDKQTDKRVARGRPAGVGTITYGLAAARLFDNGYLPIPIRTGTKVPALTRWSTVPIDIGAVDTWSTKFSDCGIGLRTGDLVGLDIDLLDADLAHEVAHKAEQTLGVTLVRVGLWPKRLLLYRTDAPFAKMQVPGIEVLGSGQQFVAFGVHPDTGRTYSWPTGDTPLDIALTDLPSVTCDQLRTFLGEASAALPSRSSTPSRSRGSPPQPNQPVRVDGLVIDGRDAWLSTIAFHAVHDALDVGLAPDAEAVSLQVWDRFVGSTDLSRARKGSQRPYRQGDARKKVNDKLRLLRSGLLPPRSTDTPEPVNTPVGRSVAAARGELDAFLANACDRIEAWHSGEEAEPAPQIGLRATVGLGKSSAARRHLLALRERLRAAGLPHRIAVFTPSHALAEECAAEWRQTGVTVAVLRGYEMRHPTRGEPMCRDVEAVRLALTAGLDVSNTVCRDKLNRACQFHDTCLKQENRREVAAADVVIAPYDALFTGFSSEPGTFALLLIDEGCWARAMTENRELKVETLAEQSISGRKGGSSKLAAAASAADLLDLRHTLMKALMATGPGAVRKGDLVAGGLTVEHCRRAAGLEYARRRDPGLYPGMSREERPVATAIAAQNQMATRLGGLFNIFGDILEGNDNRGQVRILPPDPKTGLHDLLITGMHVIHPNLRSKPVLHLDATLRPEIARRVLPTLDVEKIDASTPHMSLRLVTGRFGKSALIEDSRATGEDNARRRRHLAEVVDYVRWHALRVAPGRTLVITYQSAEAAFAGIPNVETAHFNAIAGLDAWCDVAQIILVGRPLPASEDINHLVGGFFGKEVAGGYGFSRRAVHMRDGSSRPVRVIAHGDPAGELLRSAICDDELIQAIGRGRGVNRTAQTPLEVQVLADVALPLVHAVVTSWDLAAPDLMQKMLLAGVAVDSPGDAAALHPALFGSEKQAQKAFERAGFKRHSSYKDPIREMSLKLASYRRPGRGRSWQRAWWLPGLIGEDEARALIERTLGGLAEWRRLGSVAD
ncbi:bifunctional DNA primase/polymerase [Seohaeicola nanhaiensis]|uniref:Bifunctional DNA primase/polymerase n=1 Tax=Seohaeicola nanhaiensis TaxID=1387282 RepID=A0ABV9KHJ4_9RHOB